MADKIGHHRRARGALRQPIFVAGDLGKYGGNLAIQKEIRILDEKPSDSAKIDAWKEVQKVNVEQKSPLPMLYGIREDRMVFLESVGQVVFKVSLFVDFGDAILQKLRQASLQKTQLGRWGVYLPDSAPTLRGFKRSVFRVYRFYVKYIGESARLELEKGSYFL